MILRSMRYDFRSTSDVKASHEKPESRVLNCCLTIANVCSEFEQTTTCKRIN